VAAFAAGNRSGGLTDARAASSPTEVMANPESLRPGGKLLHPSEVENLSRSGEWAKGPLGSKSTKAGQALEEGGGVKWSKLNSRGEPTGAQIRWDPAGRHTGGKPCWTIIDDTGAKFRVTDSGVERVR